MKKLSKEIVSISISIQNRDELRKLADKARWGYDSLLEDMISEYKQIKEK